MSQILGQAAASRNREICGLLLGQGDCVIRACASVNVAEESARRFEIDPAILIAAHRAHRAGGPAVIGHYHSHPGGDTAPSPCDAEMAQPDGSLWLICEPDGEYRLWRSGTDGLHGRFTQEVVDWDEDVGLPAGSGLASPAP